jgi:hypothetical protein
MAGGTDLDQLAQANSEAASVYESGHAKSAVPLFERVLDHCRAVLGADHPASLTVEGNLAVALVTAGKRREGIDLLSENLADRARVLGDEEPRTLTARDALAVAYRLAGRVDEAVALSRGSPRSAGAPSATPTRHADLADGPDPGAGGAGDIGPAATELTAAIADAESTLGPRHPHTTALLECGRSIGLVRRAS